MITCEVCARRYASRLSRRILATDPRRLFAVEIDAAVTSNACFRQWRIEVRNLLDHRRRASRWWWDTGLWVWRSHDGRVRGIASLGSVTNDEFMAALNRRWPTTLRPVDPAALREEIIAAIRPSVIYVGPGGGRYQGFKFCAWPRSPARRKPSTVLVSRGSRWIEAMPVLF